MIIQLTGSVSYPITIDPTVWIFDDRKILLEEAFDPVFKKPVEKDEIKQAEERLHRAYHEKVRPPINKGMNKSEREAALKNSYVMPIKEFIEHSEVKESATSATLITSTGEVNISLNKLKKSLLLFAIKGQPLTEDGPVHILFHDGSNKESPIKGVRKIIIN